ncbi:hypothetical protein PPUJ13061_39280 [Pseudomonas putida]|nr:hypothetical protein PPUJ13061_39280 [Pseudomonas putida]
MLDRGYRQVEAHDETPFKGVPGACCEPLRDKKSVNVLLVTARSGAGFYESRHIKQINLTDHGVIDYSTFPAALGKLIAAVFPAVAGPCTNAYGRPSRHAPK